MIDRDTHSLWSTVTMRIGPTRRWWHFVSAAASAAQPEGAPVFWPSTGPLAPFAQSHFVLAESSAGWVQRLHIVKIIIIIIGTDNRKFGRQERHRERGG